MQKKIFYDIRMKFFYRKQFIVHFYKEGESNLNQNHCRPYIYANVEGCGLLSTVTRDAHGWYFTLRSQYY